MTITTKRSLGTIATFDVFETLIVRPFDRPDDLHFFVPSFAKNITEAERPESRAWHKLRVNAERSARERNPGREVTLDEIYSVIREVLSENQETALDELMQAEKIAEERLAKPIQASWQKLILARSSNHRVAYASDMYLPMATVRNVLRCSPLYREEEDLFLSSELGCRKSDGSMFKYIAEIFGVPVSSLSHFGDNKFSDIYIPNEMGAKVALCSDVRYQRFEKVQAKATIATQPGLNYAAVGRAVRLSLPASSPASIGLVASSVVAPLASALALFTLRIAVKEKCDKVLFLARDGFIVFAAAREFMKHKKIDCDAHYFYTSRAALDEVINSIDESDCLKRFKEYVEKELGITRHSRVLIQDLGWKGSMQARFLKCLRKALGEFPDNHLFGAYLGLKEPPPEASGTFLTLAKDPKWINSSLVETIFSADHASFGSYLKQRKSEALPLDTSDLTLTFTSIHLLASVNYASTLAQLMEGFLPQNESIHSELCESGLIGLDILQRTPTLREAVAYGGIQHASNSNHRNNIQLGGPMSASQLARQLFKKAAVSSTHWPQASIVATLSLFRMTLMGEALNFVRALPFKWRRRRKSTMLAS